jgi:two-component system CheB/CheR fusion protein
VELHGGSVQARSSGHGLGSEFIVRLPLAHHTIRAVDTSQAGMSAEPATLRVLVVDDNHDAADSLRMLLESMNQMVFTVYDGAAALAAAKTFRPDVVLLDIGMPHMSGYEVARQLLASSGAEGLRPTLVAVTGWGQEADRKRTRECGFRYHFVKPVSDTAIRSMLVDESKPRGEPPARELA